MKKLSKILALTLAFVMSLCMLTSCSDSDSGSGDAANGDLTFGVVIWSTDDGLGADAKKALDTAADALGVNLIYRTGSYDAENQTTDYENLVAAGVDGILCTTLVDSSTDELLKICEDAGIPMELMFRNIIDEDAKAYCMASDNFAGYVVEDEESAGAAMVDKLIADGCKSIGLVFRENGNGVIDRRQAGVLARIDELGIESHQTVITNTATATDASDATAQLIAAYPDIDGIIMSSGSQGSIDGLITYLDGTDIELTSFDTPADLQGSFDAGNLVMVVSGAQIDPMYALINLYRKATGNPFQDTPTEVFSNYIYLESAEDIATYNEYFSDFKTYTADEIVGLTEMDFGQFVEEVSNYSLQSVVDKNS